MNLKKNFAALAAACLVFAAVPAQAADLGLYVAPKLHVGIHSLNDFAVRGANGGNTNLSGGHDWNLGLSGAVGFDLYPQYAVPARIELELAHMFKTKEDGSYNPALGGGHFAYEQKTTLNSVFVNGYFDLHNSSPLTPYVGVGLGTAWVQSKGHLNGSGLSSNTETNLAWNIGLGAAWSLNYNLSLDFGYRYASFGKTRTGNSSLGHIESKMAMHQFMGGVRYTF